MFHYVVDDEQMETVINNSPGQGTSHSLCISYGLRKAFEFTSRLELLQCLGATKFSGKFYKRFSA